MPVLEIWLDVKTLLYVFSISFQGPGSARGSERAGRVLGTIVG